MIFRDYDLAAGETLEPPQIIWERRDRYAIIAFLILSINKKTDADDLKRLGFFMGITEEDEKSDANDYEEDNNSAKGLIVRKAIICEGNLFLDKISQNENYYDCLIDELCCVIEGHDGCGIGNGYAVNSKNGKRVELKGDANRLFQYFDLVIHDDNYSENHKRFFQHLARKWGVDKSALSILESSSKTLGEINRKREEIQKSEMPHRAAVSAFAELDVQENEAREKLDKLGVGQNQLNDNLAKRLSLITSSLVSAGYLSAEDLREEEEIHDQLENDVPPSLIDKIGDGIVDGICKIGELICAPFDRLSGI